MNSFINRLSLALIPVLCALIFLHLSLLSSTSKSRQ